MFTTYYFFFSRYLKVSLVPSVSPSNWSFTTKSVNADAETPYFGDNFPVAVPKSKLSTKTLQVTIWTSDSESKSTCVGSAQISLADFNWETVCVRWYNVLSLQYILQVCIFWSIISIFRQIDFTKLQIFFFRKFFTKRKLFFSPFLKLITI